MLLMTAADMAGGDAAVVVAATTLALLFPATLHAVRLCAASGDTTRTAERRPGEVGLNVISAMNYFSGRRGHDVDRLTIGQRDVRLAPIAAATLAELEGLGLALHVHHVHCLDLGR